MMQVWLLDEQGFYTGESKFVKELTDKMSNTPILVGYIKAKWNGTEWIEGATEVEIKEWKDKQIDICSPKTNKELEEENKRLWDTVNYLLKNIDCGIPRETSL